MDSYILKYCAKWFSNTSNEGYDGMPFNCLNPIPKD